MKKIRIIRIAFLISIIFTMISISKTYAKYSEKINSNFHITINQWLIKVNSKDIMETNEFDDELQIKFEENDDFSDNVLLPGRIGFLEYDIDYSEVGVNFDINIEISAIENANRDIGIFGYSIDDGEICEESSEDQSFANTSGKLVFKDKINLLDGNSKSKIKIYIKWKDDGENQIDSVDTSYQGMTYKYKTTVLFEQRL